MQLLKTTGILVLALTVLAPVAGAAVLWDQSDFDVWGAGFWNSESGGPPFGMTNHSVADVAVPASGWTVGTITVYYSGMDFNWGNTITEGYLHVWPKTGSVPVEDPTLSPKVPMSAVFDLDHWVVTASDLHISLAAGDYWVSITPVATGGMFGPELGMSSMTPMGPDGTPTYDVFGFPMPMWASWNPGVDMAIRIDGFLGENVPTVSEWGLVVMSLLGCCVGTCLFARHRKLAVA